MRRLCEVFLVGLLAAGIVGCSPDSETSTSNSTEPSPPPEQIENEGPPPTRTSRGDKDPAAFEGLKPPGTDEAADSQ